MSSVHVSEFESDTSISSSAGTSTSFLALRVFGFFPWCRDCIGLICELSYSNGVNSSSVCSLLSELFSILWTVSKRNCNWVNTNLVCIYYTFCMVNVFSLNKNMSYFSKLLCFYFGLAFILECLGGYAWSSVLSYYSWEVDHK